MREALRMIFISFRYPDLYLACFSTRLSVCGYFSTSRPLAVKICRRLDEREEGGWGCQRSVTVKEPTDFNPLNFTIRMSRHLGLYLALKFGMQWSSPNPKLYFTSGKSAKSHRTSRYAGWQRIAVYHQTDRWSGELNFWPSRWTVHLATTAGSRHSISVACLMTATKCSYG